MYRFWQTLIGWVADDHMHVLWYRRCACTKCWRLVDVKNVGQSLQVPREEAQEEFCRKLRANCRVVNFCSLAHKALCTKTATPKTGWTCCYGPRTSSHFVWGCEGVGTMECSSHAAATVHRRTMTHPVELMWSCVGSQQGLCHVHFNYSYITIYLQKKTFHSWLSKTQIKHWLKIDRNLY